MKAAWPALLLAAALAGPASAAPAATVITDCTESGFDAAMASGGDITFNCGGPKTITLTHPATIPDSLTTLDGGNTITLTGNLSTTLLAGVAGARLTVSNIVLDQGNSHSGDGGAITGISDLTLEHVTIQSSQSGDVGGAIYTTGQLTIRDSRFIGNQAHAGGAIYALDSVEMTIEDSVFQLNEATDNAAGDGGAIYLGPTSTLAITGGQFGSNGAHGVGGALYVGPGAQVTIGPSGATAAEINANSGYHGGGGIYNDGGTLTLDDTLVEGNQTLTTTSAYGGGIADYGALTLVDSAVASNGSRYGGGLFVGDGTTLTATAAITHTSFIDNLAAQDGGGLYTNVNSTTVSLENDLIADNQAGAAGGGLARTNAKLTISRSSFTANQAHDGGGLFVQGLPSPDSAGYVELRDSTISSNTATSSHSGGIEDAALLDVRNVTLTGNSYGLFIANSSGSTIARLQATVLDNPSALNCDGAGLTPQPTSGGFNLATDNSCGLTGGEDMQGTGLDAKLGPPTSDAPLVFTIYRVPLPGSPLINAGGPVCSASDQRYALRRDACDIGAVEFGGLLPRLFLPLLKR